MLKENRHHQIVEWVNKNNSATVKELSEKFCISQSTISRDLQILNLSSKLIKTHGGAVSISKGLEIEPSFENREIQSTQEKQRIAKKAVEYIKPGQTIIIDSGTTTFWMIKYLRDIGNINVWTNDLHIMYELINLKNVEITLLGGKLRKKYLNTMGVLTNRMLDNIHVDQLYIGVDAINVESGLMVYSPEEAELKRLMIEIANETIVLCDHSKFEKKALMGICPIERVHKVVTGRETDKNYINMIRQLNISVDVA
jgi:DeoR family fructose operon transcriptional repressor